MEGLDNHIKKRNFFSATGDQRPLFTVEPVLRGHLWDKEKVVL